MRPGKAVIAKKKKNQVAELESEIARLESESETIQDKLAAPDADFSKQSELIAGLEKCREEIERCEREWEELTLELEESA